LITTVMRTLGFTAVVGNPLVAEMENLYVPAGDFEEIIKYPVALEEVAPASKAISPSSEVWQGADRSTRVQVSTGSGAPVKRMGMSENFPTG
jgi:hypothetical protein